MGFARASESVFPALQASRPGPKGCAEGAPNVPDKEGGFGRGELAPPLHPLPRNGGEGDQGGASAHADDDQRSEVGVRDLLLRVRQQRDGRIPELHDGPLSSSEVLQRHLGTAHVVKVFNNITFWHLASLVRPAGAADRSALPIAGDDPAAKAAVTRFLDAIGYDTVDAGPLGSGGRRFQFGTRAFVAPYGGLSDQRGTPAGAAAVRAALGA